MSEIRISRMIDDPVTLAHQTGACGFFCIPFINGVELVKWTVEMYTPHVMLYGEGPRSTPVAIFRGTGVSVALLKL